MTPPFGRGEGKWTRQIARRIATKRTAAPFASFQRGNAPDPPDHPQKKTPPPPPLLFRGATRQPRQTTPLHTASQGARGGARPGPITVTSWPRGTPGPYPHQRQRVDGIALCGPGGGNRCFVRAPERTACSHIRLGGWRAPTPSTAEIGWVPESVTCLHTTKGIIVMTDFELPYPTTLTDDEVTQVLFALEVSAAAFKETVVDKPT